MKFNELQILFKLDLYKKLSMRAKHLYLILDKIYYSYGQNDWFYVSSSELKDIMCVSNYTLSKIKKELLFYELIKIKRHYSINGIRGSDYWHILNLSEIQKKLKNNNDNIKDLQIIKNLSEI